MESFVPVVSSEASLLNTTTITESAGKWAAAENKLEVPDCQINNSELHQIHDFVWAHNFPGSIVFMVETSLFKWSGQVHGSCESSRTTSGLKRDLQAGIFMVELNTAFLQASRSDRTVFQLLKILVQCRLCSDLLFHLFGSLMEQNLLLLTLNSWNKTVWSNLETIAELQTVCTMPN